MRTPHESFLLSGKAPAWAKVVAGVPELETACDYALLEMASEINDPMNPTGLAQIVGARRVLEILKTIAEPVKPPTTAKRESLHYLIMPETTQQTVNYPTSKRPNPSKFHHNNRCLLPFHKQKIVGENKRVAFVAERNPGQIIKANDGRFTYQVQRNGALVKVQNTQ